MRTPIPLLYLLLSLLLPGWAFAQGNRPDKDVDWRKLTFSRNHRAEGQAVTYNGEIYLFNGFTYGLTFQDVNERYDPATDTWTTLASTPHRPDGRVGGLTHTGIAVADDEIWIVAGRAGFLPFTPEATVWVYTPATDSWRQGPPLPEARGGGGLANLGRKLHYVGGFDEHGMCDVDDHWVLDLDNVAAGWQDYRATSPMPLARNHFGTATLDGMLYVVGGQHGHDGCNKGQNKRYVHRYDPITDTWERLADLPYVNSHTEPGTFAYNGKIYAVGGQAAQARDVLEYDPATDSWEVRRDLRMPVRLIATAARVYDERLLILTGGEVSVDRPQTLARSAAFDPNRTRELAFHPATLSLDGAGEREVILANRSHDDLTGYTIDAAGLPDWLNVVPATGTARESSEKVTVQVDPTALPGGTHTYTLTARAPGYAPAELTVSVTGDGPSAPAADSFWGEVECGTYASDWQRRDAPGQSGSGFLAWAGGNDFGAPAADNRQHVTLATPVLAAGTYRLYLRMDAPDNGSNSVWMRVDSGKWIKFWKDTQGRNILSDGFEWYEVTDASQAVRLSLAAGTHRITIANREAGTRLDKVYLTATGATPTGAGAPADNCTSNTARTVEAAAAATGNLELFPNPATTELRLRLTTETEGPVLATLIDANGRVLRQLHYTKAGKLLTETLDVSGLPAGVYRLSLTDNADRIIRPFVVTR